MLAAKIKAKGANRGIAAPSISVEDGARMVLDKLRALNPDQTPTSPSPVSSNAQLAASQEPQAQETAKYQPLEYEI